MEVEHAAAQSQPQQQVDTTIIVDALSNTLRTSQLTTNESATPLGQDQRRSIKRSAQFFDGSPGNEQTVESSSSAAPTKKQRTTAQIVANASRVALGIMPSTTLPAFTQEPPHTYEPDFEQPPSEDESEESDEESESEDDEGNVMQGVRLKIPRTLPNDEILEYQEANSKIPEKYSVNIHPDKEPFYRYPPAFSLKTNAFILKVNDLPAIGALYPELADKEVEQRDVEDNGVQVIRNPKFHMTVSLDAGKHTFDPRFSIRFRLPAGASGFINLRDRRTYRETTFIYRTGFQVSEGTSGRGPGYSVEDLDCITAAGAASNWDDITNMKWANLSTCTIENNIEGAMDFTKHPRSEVTSQLVKFSFTGRFGEIERDSTAMGHFTEPLRSNLASKETYLSPSHLKTIETMWSSETAHFDIVFLATSNSRSWMLDVYRYLRRVVDLRLPIYHPYCKKNEQGIWEIDMSLDMVPANKFANRALVELSSAQKQIMDQQKAARQDSRAEFPKLVRIMHLPVHKSFPSAQAMAICLIGDLIRQKQGQQAELLRVTHSNILMTVVNSYRGPKVHTQHGYGK